MYFMKKIILLHCIFCLMACGGHKMTNADTTNIKNKHIDIAYASASPSQKMDIYLPDSGKNFPVIVSIHGGAFMFGDKQDEQLTPMLEGLKRGYAVVSINYRLSNEAIFPAQIFDVKAAIRYIKANASQYGLDSSRVAVWGGSAGGYLSTMIGVTPHVASLEDLNMGNSQVSSSVKAVVDWFGPVNFLTMDEAFQKSNKGKADHNDANSPESKLLGAAITTVPEKVKNANPETYLTANGTRFLIQHGTEDQFVPFEQSQSLYEKMKPILGEQNVTFLPIVGAKHGGQQFNTKENLNIVFDFLDKNLKNR
jgi:acetyl esterase/lipase